MAEAQAVRILPGWRNSQPLDPEREGLDQWQWTISATPSDGPAPVWLTLHVRRVGMAGTWHWAINQPNGGLLWAGTGSATLQDAVTHACHQLTAQLGVPLTVLA